MSDPGNKEAKFIEPINTESIKELEIAPGPSNDTDAKDIKDKMEFKYRYILGVSIFTYV